MSTKDLSTFPSLSPPPGQPVPSPDPPRAASIGQTRPPRSRTAVRTRTGPFFLVCVDHTPSDRPRLDIVDSGAAQEANQLAERPFSRRQLFPSCWPYLFSPAATAALLVCLCVCSGPRPSTDTCPPLSCRNQESSKRSRVRPQPPTSGSVTSSSGIASCKPPANRILFQPPIPFILSSLHLAEPTTVSARLGGGCRQLPNPRDDWAKPTSPSHAPLPSEVTSGTTISTLPRVAR